MSSQNECVPGVTARKVVAQPTIMPWRRQNRQIGRRRLAGGLGRDILAGGDDADQINADDNEEDILIAGVTAYEDIASDATHQKAWE
jgi:hypothetical protein